MRDMDATSFRTAPALSANVAFGAHLVFGLETAGHDAFASAFIAGSPDSALSAIAPTSLDVADTLQHQAAVTLFKTNDGAREASCLFAVSFTARAQTAITSAVLLTDSTTAPMREMQVRTRTAAPHRTHANDRLRAGYEALPMRSKMQDAPDARTPPDAVRSRVDRHELKDIPSPAIVRAAAPSITSDTAAPEPLAVRAITVSTPAPLEALPSRESDEVPRPSDTAVDRAIGVADDATVTSHSAAQASLASVAYTSVLLPTALKVDAAAASVEIYRTEGSTETRTQSSRLAAYARRIAERGLLTPHTGFVYFQKPGEAPRPRTVTAIIEREKEQDVVVEAQVGAALVREYYRAQGGQLHFTGFEERRAEPPPLPAIPPREYSDRPLLPLGRGSIFAFGSPGGETAWARSPVDVSDPAVGEELILLLMAQLSQGPASLASDGLRTRFKLDLGQTLSREDWEALLAESIAEAVRQTPVMDERGARPIAAIQDDAAFLLQIDAARLAEWEEYFDVNSIASALYAPERSPVGESRGA